MVRDTARAEAERATGPAADPAAWVHRTAALLLRRPDHTWPDRHARVTYALGRRRGPEADRLLRFCRATTGVPLRDLAARYVTTFDRARRRTLHLADYTAGGTRHRYAALAALEARYRRHGFTPAAGEPPDHLPAVLDFAARRPDEGRAVLAGHRDALDLLARSLTAHRSPYADVVEAVRETLSEAGHGPTQGPTQGPTLGPTQGPRPRGRAAMDAAATGGPRR